MILFRHELRRNRVPLALWASSIALMLLVCMLIFPEMKSQFDMVNSLFKNLGAFTAAFGMDRINFATAIGFYGIECGNVLGLCGGIFAALLGASALSGEEQGHTAEFLLTHPVRRTQIVAEKLLAVWVQILLLNAIVLAFGWAGYLLVGETPEQPAFLMFHLAHLLLQLEIASLCFGLSAFMHRGAIGAGVAIVAGLYFLNLANNLSDKAGCLRYITPYAYAEAAPILEGSGPELAPVLAGMALAAAALVAGFTHYARKDILA